MQISEARLLRLVLSFPRLGCDCAVTEQGVFLEAQEAKIRAMATVQSAELLDVIVDGGESAKSLNRPGLQHLLDLINAGKVDTVIVAKLDRLTRSVKTCAGCWSCSKNARSRWFRSPSRSKLGRRRAVW